MQNICYCEKCCLSFYSDRINQTLCPSCESELAPKRKSNARHILKDTELGGEVLAPSLYGYNRYLIKKNYTSDDSYVSAVKKVMEKERISFNYLYANIAKYIAKYGKSGEESELGATGHNTVICALKAIEKFKEYNNGTTVAA